MQSLKNDFLQNSRIRICELKTDYFDYSNSAAKPSIPFLSNNLVIFKIMSVVLYCNYNPFHRIYLGTQS